jgi:heme/copper-type cytochrome/quinol oxidase subunit 1
LHFWLTLVGFHTTFLIRHWLGGEGMPRRYADYLPTDQFTTMHTISTIGAFVLGAGTSPTPVSSSARQGRVMDHGIPIPREARSGLTGTSRDTADAAAAPSGKGRDGGRAVARSCGWCGGAVSR